MDKTYRSYFFSARENKRAQTLLSPLWKDRSGRLPGTALSITSPRFILRLPSKTQDPGSGPGQSPACAKFFFNYKELRQQVWVGVFP